MEDYRFLQQLWCGSVGDPDKAKSHRDLRERRGKIYYI